MVLCVDQLVFTISGCLDRRKSIKNWTRQIASSHDPKHSTSDGVPGQFQTKRGITCVGLRSLHYKPNSLEGNIWVHGVSAGVNLQWRGHGKEEMKNPSENSNNPSGGGTAGDPPLWFTQRERRSPRRGLRAKPQNDAGTITKKTERWKQTGFKRRNVILIHSGGNGASAVCLLDLEAFSLSL